MHGIARLIVLMCGAISTAYAADLPSDQVGGVSGKQGTRMEMEASLSYLENSADERTQRWIAKRNERLVTVLETDSRFDRYYRIALDNLNDQDSLTNPTAIPVIQDGVVYQLWRTSDHPRGTWRRTALNQLLARAPHWETLLDIDALARVEGRSLSLHTVLFSPGGTRCMLGLVREGIAVEWREFDVQRRMFVTDGFKVPATKGSSVDWRDENTLVVAADWGAGTIDGYGLPLVIKEWSRAQSFENARELLRRPPDPTLIYVVPQRESNSRSDTRATRSITMKAGSRGWFQLDEHGRLAPMTIPAGVLEPVLFQGHYVFALPDAEDWTIAGKTWKAGTLVAIPASQITQSAPTVQSVVELQAGETLFAQLVPTTAGMLVFRSYRGQIALSRIRLDAGRWQVDPVPLPEHGFIRPFMSDPASSSAFILYESELQPQTLYRVDVRQNHATIAAMRSARFDSGRFVVEELTAKSTDGISVPYRIVHDRSMRRDGNSPVLIAGYGAAAAPLYPQYDANLGDLWLEQGGVYVAAGVRGGGEYGAAWHVRGRDRQHTYDDMLAVVRDLIARRITSPKRIGVFGHSAGGLLAGVMITQRPDLFGAAILLAPMLDNFRLDLLLSGEEYFGPELGSPNNPRDRDFLARTSPLQNVRKRDDFPMPLILTATDDQNVQPAQPRRFAATMDGLGLPYLFHESADGGHAAAAEGPGRARLEAWMYTYLAQQLLDPRSGSTGRRESHH